MNSRYLTGKDLIDDKEVLRYLDVIAREYWGEVEDKN